MNKKCERSVFKGMRRIESKAVRQAVGQEGSLSGLHRIYKNIYCVCVSVSVKSVERVARVD